jgi:hypothetical protein
MDQMLQRPTNFEYLTIHSNDFETTAKNLKESGAVYLGRNYVASTPSYVSPTASTGDYYILQGQLILIAKKE